MLCKFTLIVTRFANLCKVKTFFYMNPQNKYICQNIHRYVLKHLYKNKYCYIKTREIYKFIHLDIGRNIYSRERYYMNM